MAISLSVYPATVAASYGQGLSRNACNHEFGTSSHFQLPSSAILSPRFCSLDKNIPFSFCASKDRGFLHILRTEREIASISPLATARDESDVGRLSTPKISPLPAIISCITTGVIFAIWQERRAAKMGLRPHQLSWSQNMQVIPPCLLVGLVVTIFLSVLEVSLRALLK